MKNWVVILILMSSVSGIGHCQMWDEMAQYTMQLESRNDSTDLWLNHHIKVELRDYGINEFTIFQDTATQYRYFIYRCACGDATISLIGGRDRISDFYRLKDIINVHQGWLITDFETKIALSHAWSAIESMSRRKMNKHCVMTIN